ncbi:MAG: TonB-dependent receptor [Deltaproteobacteria bacterium]|jgi:hemoglobin/transferrin/lactoferrin receptor protein|nr:TonB-dependent receptor [Deltaproteobacteria bacterium]
MNYLKLIITRITVFSTILFFFLFSYPAAATDKNNNKSKNEQDKLLKESGQEDENIEEEIVVTAKAQKEKKGETHRAVSTVNSRDLAQKPPRTTPEALIDLPGVFLQKTNHGGGAPIIRGQIGPGVLLLFDGIRLNNSVYRTGPLQYLNLVDPLFLSQIEVMRGNGSVLYGSDAIGGVINLLPINASRDFSADLSARYSSADRGRIFNAKASFSSGTISTLASASFKIFDNLRAASPTGEQIWTGYEQQSFYLKTAKSFKWGIFDKWNLSLNYMYSSIPDAGRTDKLTAQNKLQIYDNKIHLFYSKLKFRFPIAKTSGELAFSFQHFQENTQSWVMADNLIDKLEGENDFTQVYTPALDLRLKSTILDKTLFISYGGMLYRDWVDSELNFRDSEGNWSKLDYTSYPDGSSYQNWGIYLNSEYRLLQKVPDHTIKLYGGYRFHGIEGNSPSRNALPEVDFSLFGNVFNFGVQHLYKELINTSLVFSQGFRAPNLQETVMLGNAGKYFHVPNPDLKPEYSDSIEFTTGFSSDRFALSVSSWLSRIEGIIDREESQWEGNSTIDGQQVVQSVNGDRGLVTGVETAFLTRLKMGLYAGGNLTYVWGESKNNDGETHPLSRIPPIYGMLKLGYKNSFNANYAGFLEGYLRFARKQDRLSTHDESDLRIPDNGTPGWYTINLRAWLGIFNYPHKKAKTFVTLDLNNLADVHYKYHGSGVWAPGRSFILSLRSSF